MGRWKKWIAAVLGIIIAIFILYFVLSFVFVDFFVNILWHKSLGFQGYLWLRILYKYLVFAITTLIFFMIFFLNFWVASRYLGTTYSDQTDNAKAPAKLIRAFRSGSMTVYTPLSILLAILIAIPLYQQWESALLYVFGPDSGVTDPVYNVDISYYLFSLPIYNLLQKKLLITVLVLFFGLLILYYLEKQILASEERQRPRGAKIHLSIIIFLVFLFQGWGYILERHQLLYNDNHLPLFFGPGFTEIKVILPLIWLTTIFLMATAVSLIVYIHTRKGFFILVILAVLFVMFHAARGWDSIPNMVEKYIVKPNEFTRQKQYIKNSIHSTLVAYELENVEIRDLEKQETLRTISEEQVKKNLRNIPAWNRELLGDVYQQLQGIRPYYDFTDVDVDRYEVEDFTRQVHLSAREITLSKLSNYAQNWVNLHLKYTHGYGLVMTPAAQGGDELMEWYIKDVPPESAYFEIEQPGIYYGMEDYPFIIAPNDIGELNYPSEKRDIEVNYKGSGGVSVSSLFKKLFFAIYFDDRNIFFTTKTNSESRILFRRNIRDCFRILTPFFKLDKDPYLVVTSKKLYWIQDAFTTSDWYPHAAPYEQRLNYIRNSVKIVVDAYSGKISYYISAPDDPIVQGYERMYPGLLKPLEQIPEEVFPHIRFPGDLFEIQMSIYAKYHQTDPETFYQDEDRWEFSKFYRNGEHTEIKPYYLTLNLIDPDKSEFLLLTSMSPKGRDNLRALPIIGNDQDNYGRIIVYSFSKGRQVFGPSQITALIEQDTEIAEQFTLWDQIGSEVRRGKMIIFPIGKDLLFIQPVYLSAAGELKIPELKRLILSQGDVVVMDSSLEKAFQKLKNKLDQKLGPVSFASEVSVEPQIKEPSFVGPYRTEKNEKGKETSVYDVTPEGSETHR